jgi:hypothetical protein
MLEQQQYGFDPESRAAFSDYLERRMQQPHFSNARSVRNALDRIKLRHANRILHDGGKVSLADLTRIDALDVRQSRVFEDEGGVS